MKALRAKTEVSQRRRHRRKLQESGRVESESPGKVPLRSRLNKKRKKKRKNKQKEKKQNDPGTLSSCNRDWDFKGR